MFSSPPQEQGSLVQGKDRECGWNNPADRVREPWPAILVGVETNVAIGSTKLPFPEPIRFLAGTVHAASGGPATLRVSPAPDREEPLPPAK